VVNPVTGHLYVVFANKASSTDRGDIFLCVSTDGGATWRPPVRVNTDATSADQWQPTLAVTPNGRRVGVFWYDRRLGPANTLLDYYGRLGTATSDGVAFEADFRV